MFSYCYILNYINNLKKPSYFRVFRKDIRWYNVSVSKLSLIKIFSWTYKYILFFIPTSIIIILLWSFVISDNLYYCSDKIPLLDFFPPFVHGPLIGDRHIISTGDYFLVNEKLVWAFWLFLVSLIFLVPYYLVIRTNLKRKVKLLKKQ